MQFIVSHIKEILQFVNSQNSLYVLWITSRKQRADVFRNQNQTEELLGKVRTRLCFSSGL